MINKIWLFLVVGGILFSFYRGIDVSEVILNSSYHTYELILSLGPILVLWSGIIRIASSSGLLKKISRLFRPFLSKLMPSVKSDKALEYISTNIAANMLGLGSVATPSGLQAMEELDKENNRKKRASEGMITFLVLNTSGVTLIPMSVIALRTLYESSSPSRIIIPSIIATSVSTIVGLTIDYMIRMSKHG